MDGLQRWELYEEIMETLSNAASNDLIIQGTSRPREDTSGAACVVYWMLTTWRPEPGRWYLDIWDARRMHNPVHRYHSEVPFTTKELGDLSDAFESGTGDDPTKDGCVLFHNKLMEILNLDTVSPLIDIKFVP